MSEKKSKETRRKVDVPLVPKEHLSDWFSRFCQFVGMNSDDLFNVLSFDFVMSMDLLCMNKDGTIRKDIHSNFLSFLLSYKKRVENYRRYFSELKDVSQKDSD